MERFMLRVVNAAMLAVFGPSPEWAGRPAVEPKPEPIYVITFADGSRLLTRIHPTLIAARLHFDRPTCRAGMS